MSNADFLRTVQRIWVAILASHVVIFAVAFSRILEVYSDRGSIPLTALLGITAVGTAAGAQRMWRRFPRATSTEEAYASCIGAWALDQAVAIHGLALTIFGTPISSGRGSHSLGERWLDGNHRLAAYFHVGPSLLGPSCWVGESNGDA